jgi:hypothetical protein
LFHLEIITIAKIHTQKLEYLMKNRLFKTCVTGLLLSLAGLANADHVVPSTNGNELDSVSVGTHAKHAVIPVAELITINSLAASGRVNDADVD